MRRPARAKQSLLRNGDFVKLWWGQAVSETGSAVTALALPLLAIIRLDATALQVGALQAVEMAPFLLVGLPAGAVVDRLRRRRVLIAADVGRLLTLGSIPVAGAFGWLALPQLYVVAAVSGLLTVFFDVAYQSYLPALVPRDQLTVANSRLGATQQISTVAGPALGGLLVSAVGAATAVAADAFSYLVSVSSLVFIRRQEPRPVRAAGTSRLRGLGRETREGIRYVLRQPTLRMIAACTGSSNLAAAVTQAVLTLFMVRRLHLSPAQIGGVFAAASVGGFLGAVIAGRMQRWLGVGAATIAGVTAGSLSMLLIPLARPGWTTLLIPAGSAVAAAGFVLYNIGTVSYRQAVTPDHLLGRMTATMRFMVWGTLPIGSLIGGVLGATIGLRPTLWVAAIAGLVSPLFVLLSPLRGIRHIPVESVVESEAALAG